MFRTNAILCWLALSLITVASGCGGGSSDVAQSAAPAGPRTITPAASPETTSDGYEPDSSMTAEAPSSEMNSGDEMNSGGMMSMGAPGMSSDGYSSTETMMYGGAPGYDGQGYGGTPQNNNPLSSFGSMFGFNMGGNPNGMGAGDGYGMGAGDGYGGAGMDGYGMSGQNNAPSFDPAPAEDADLLTKAKYAFSIGKEKEALEYARAYAVATEETGEVQQKTRWYTAGTQPATTVRFAVGVILEAPAALVDLKPMGAKQLQGGGGGMSGMAGGQGSPNTVKDRPFYSMTGTFGEALVSSFHERWTSGKLGLVFNEVTPVKAKAVGPNNAGGMMGMMGSSMGMASDGLGSAGDGYGGDPGMMDPSGAGRSVNQPKVLPGSVLTPGMVYLGTSDKQATLMEKAAQQHVDAVFLFDVTVSAPNRINGVIQNEARLRLVNLKGDLLARSSELLNTKVERALMPNIGEDEVKKAIDKFFAQFDEKVQLTEMPAIKPEHAKARLTQLLANKDADKLQKLFEVSLFHSMKLISDEDRATCYLIVMEGSEGDSLASGALIDKMAVLEPLLPAYQ